MDASEQIKRFGDLLEKYYKKGLSEAVRQGDNFLVVDFTLLAEFDPELAEELLETPEEVIKAAELAVQQIELDKKTKNFKIRFSMIPESQFLLIRDIRSKHLGKLLLITGIVRQKSDVRPQVTSAKFECPSCGKLINVLQLDVNFKEPTRCGCGRKGKFRLAEKELVDAQSLVLEEDPENLSGGSQPKRMRVFLRDDLVSPLGDKKTNPGSKISVVGSLKEIPIETKMGGKSTRYDLLIEGNYIDASEESFQEVVVNEEEEEQIKALSKIAEKSYDSFIQSIAPSIYGHDKIKEALLMQLMGGVRKERADGVVSRGDIHVLLVGDPGSGKSQMLKRVNKIAPKGRYVSGKGVSGAGLCIAPDSLIMTNPGLKIIKNEVENNFENKKQVGQGIWEAVNNNHKANVLSIDNNLKVKATKIKSYWKIKAPKEMVLFKTQSGKEIKATKNTKLYTLEDSLLTWKESIKLKKGNYLATLRNFKARPHKQPLIFDMIVSNPILYDVKPIVKIMIEKLAKKYGSKRNAAKKLGFSEGNLYYNWINKKARGNIQLNDFKKLMQLTKTTNNEVAKHIKKVSLRKGKYHTIPQIINKELAYFAGLVAGDGDISGSKHSISIRFSNNSKQLLNKFATLAEKLFNIKCGYSYQEKRTPSVRFSSKIVAEILHSLGVPKSPKSDKIDITNTMLESGEIKFFLKAIFDCDGSVCQRTTKGSSLIDLTTTSSQFAKKLQLVLLKWKIKSKQRVRKPDTNSPFKGKKMKHIIEIRGKDNLIKFQKEIGFFSREKQKKLCTIINKITKQNTNIDLIPNVQKILKKVKDNTAVTSKEMIGYKSSSYASKHFMPSRDRIKKIVRNITKTKKTCEELKLLELLSNSDITWEKIVDKKIIKNHGYDYVYDLTVENSHSFFANGVLVHNTASVVRDEFLKGWALEAGALVLSDNGVCCIDELDKMSPEDRDSMHEALEQQSVSIAKANIQATLMTRTTVLAAANPKIGRFDPYDILAKQIDLPPALVNRFDLIFPIKDMPEKKKDEALATHILNLHDNPDANKPEIDTEIFRKYISYARQRCKPKLTRDALEAIKNYYVKTRTQVGEEDGGARTIPITARQLEALVRLGEASAKVRLGKEVTVDDANRAIDLLHFCLLEVGLDLETGKIDIDRIGTGISATDRSKIVIVREIIHELENKLGKTIPIEDVIREATAKGLKEADVEETIEKLKRQGDLFEPRKSFLSRI